MGHYGWVWGGGDWLAMTLVMITVWAGVVGLVVWVVRSSRPSPQAPEDVLADRLARGEIDGDEYRRRRDALVGAGGSSGERA